MSIKTRVQTFVEKHNKHQSAPPMRCTLSKWIMWVSWLLLSCYIIPCWVYGGSLNEEIGGQPYPGLGTAFWWIIYAVMWLVWMIAGSMFDYFWHENRPERLERKQRFREAELRKRFPELVDKLWRQHSRGYTNEVDARNRWLPLFMTQVKISLNRSSNCLAVGSGAIWRDQPAFRIGLDFDARNNRVEIVRYDSSSNRVPLGRLTYREYRCLLKAFRVLKP